MVIIQSYSKIRKYKESHKRGGSEENDGCSSPGRESSLKQWSITYFVHRYLLLWYLVQIKASSGLV